MYVVFRYLVIYHHLLKSLPILTLDTSLLNIPREVWLSPSGSRSPPLLICCRQLHFVAFSNGTTPANCNQELVGCRKYFLICGGMGVWDKSEKINLMRAYHQLSPIIRDMARRLLLSMIVCVVCVISLYVICKISMYVICKIYLYAISKISLNTET